MLGPGIVYVDGCSQTSYSMQELASADGFSHLSDLHDFIERRRDFPFEGRIIN
jgi:hypothetical protein